MNARSAYKNEKNKVPFKINVPRIITATFAGVAGGVAIASSLPAGATGIISGSILGGVVTGVSEYRRERKKQNSKIEYNPNEGW